jgi:hypothetical protein
VRFVSTFMAQHGLRRHKKLCLGPCATRLLVPESCWCILVAGGRPATELLLDFDHQDVDEPLRLGDYRRSMLTGRQPGEVVLQQSEGGVCLLAKDATFWSQCVD